MKKKMLSQIFAPAKEMMFSVQLNSEHLIC